MDKASLLELLLLNSKNSESTKASKRGKGDRDKDGGWVGSSSAKIPGPLGRNTAGWVKSFNLKLLDELDENKLKNQPGYKPFVINGERPPVRYSPLEAYSKHIAESGKEERIARALAFGNAGMLPGASIGERHVSRKRERPAR